jgi:hypothetical protein
MRAVGVLLLILCGGSAQTQPAAQTPQNAGLVRGVVLECDAQGASGELSVRAADNQVFRYQFDRKTYAERDEKLIEASRLLPGEKVEIVSDHLPGLTLRYARTIHVIQLSPPVRPQSQGRLRAYNPRLDQVRTGNLTYSGVVFRLNGQRVVLHTREAGDLAIRLRQDTRYLADGQVVDLSHLQANMRVFVLAGKDLYDEVEAYQVIWGKILSPQ